VQLAFTFAAFFELLRYCFSLSVALLMPSLDFALPAFDPTERGRKISRQRIMRIVNDKGYGVSDILFVTDLFVICLVAR
jgi:hypothetical protein